MNNLPTKLVVGLGNPGKQYDQTWHNVGFMILDYFQAEFSFATFKSNDKLQAEVAIDKFKIRKVILAKPSTFMNLSGMAVSALMHYHKIDISNLIILHDDIDLPLGRIKISYGASAGGHNGIKSIIEHLKSQQFIRIRVGIKTELSAKVKAEKYVLKKISATEKKVIIQEISQATNAIEQLLTDTPLEKVMNNFN